ncbi:dispanin subfamily A member 2b-like [Paroedura picta]|uniref:dispanin subfamily A member 2b-like n=1 Tax=Paroedura picta TaxID=143630 RepID=UPI0010154815
MQSAPQLVSLNMQPHDLKDPGMAAPPYTYPRSVPARQPRDFVLWSLFNFFFLNACCLGFIALVFSFKSRDRKVVGDIEGATSYGSTAKGLNIAALILSLVFIILFIVLLASGVIAVQQLANHMEQQQQYSSLDNYWPRNGK